MVLKINSTRTISKKLIKDHNAVGIKENLNRKIYPLFYPNPTSNAITLQANLNEIYEVKIFDARGMLVINQNVNHGDQINLQHLSEGIYYINLYNQKSGLRKNQKIVLTKP